MLMVLVSISVVVVKGVHSALAILENIESEVGAMSMGTISNAASQGSATSGSLKFNLVLLLTILCWIFGVVDAYRIGKEQDIEEGTMSQVSNGKGD